MANCQGSEEVASKALSLVVNLTRKVLTCQRLLSSGHGQAIVTAMAAHQGSPSVLSACARIIANMLCNSKLMSSVISLGAHDLLPHAMLRCHLSCPSQKACCVVIAQLASVRQDLRNDFLQEGVDRSIRGVQS